MTIPARARRDSPTRPSFKTLAACAALFLAACGQSSEPVVPSPSPSASDDPDCLVVIWQNHPSRDEAFDRAHDRAEGGAISCATGASASQFEDALAAIRAAAARGDKAALLDRLGVPLLYIDAKGARRQVQREDLADALFDEVFDARTIALLSRVKLEDLTVVAGQGAFVELGSIWLVVDPRGGQPRIATVNRQALDEAAEAARRATDEGRTRPAPVRD